MYAVPRSDFDQEYWQSRERLGASRCRPGRPCCRQPGLYSATFTKPVCLTSPCGAPRMMRVQVPQRGPRMPPPQMRYNPYESAAIFFPIPHVNMDLYGGGTTRITSTGTLVYEPRGPFNRPDDPPFFEQYGRYNYDHSSWLDAD